MLTCISMYLKIDGWIYGIYKAKKRFWVKGDKWLR